MNTLTLSAQQDLPPMYLGSIGETITDLTLPPNNTLQHPLKQL